MSVFSFPSNFCQVLSNSAQARHGCQCHAYFQMQRYAWNWDRWWIFTFFKLLPLTTVGLSPRPTMGASFLLLGFFISLTNALVLGIFFGREQVSVSNNWDTMLLFKWRVVTSLTPSSRNRRTLHTQVTQFQDTSPPIAGHLHRDSGHCGSCWKHVHLSLLPHLWCWETSEYSKNLKQNCCHNN